MTVATPAKRRASEEREDRESRTERYSDIIAPRILMATTATVIGCGAIGRQVALQLAVMGVGAMELWDFDAVEPVNLGSQGWSPDQLGAPKVEALQLDCTRMNPFVKINVHAEEFTHKQEAPDVVFTCVDSMDARRDIASLCRDGTTRFFSESRMDPHTCRILVVYEDGDEKELREQWKQYEKTLFKQSEAQEGRCTARTTIYTANIAAGLMVNTYVQWARGNTAILEPDKALCLCPWDIIDGLT